MSEQFGSWLTTMATALGYPRDSDLACALHIPQSTIHRWKRGSRPTVEHLARVSRLFHTDLEVLLVLAGHMPPGQAFAAPRPPEARTLTQRRIDEAGLPPEVAEALRGYLAARYVEEDRRVQMLLHGGTDLAAYYRTSLAHDVTAVVFACGNPLAELGLHTADSP